MTETTYIEETDNHARRLAKHAGNAESKTTLQSAAHPALAATAHKKYNQRPPIQSHKMTMNIQKMPAQALKNFMLLTFAD